MDPSRHGPTGSTRTRIEERQCLIRRPWRRETNDRRRGASQEKRERVPSRMPFPGPSARKKHPRRAASRSTVAKSTAAGAYNAVLNHYTPDKASTEVWEMTNRSEERR